MTGSNFHVAIIGGGASGVLTAAQLHRQQPDLSVALIDSTGTGRGLAYGTPHLVHLLNVPAGNMSAFPDQPEHFHYWLRQVDPWAARTTFAPRKVYGDYLNHVLEEACRAPSKVERITGTAVAVERGEGPSRWRVTLAGGARLEANTVILALGNLPPAVIATARGLKGPRYVNDPWAPGALDAAVTSAVSRDSAVSRQPSAFSASDQPSESAVSLQDDLQLKADSSTSRLSAESDGWRLRADGPVLLIGTGLTAIDVILALKANGHTGPIHCLSRRGLLPKAHAPCEPWKLSEDLFGTPDSGLRPPDSRFTFHVSRFTSHAESPLALLNWLRQEIRRAETAGTNWRAVIDALRPHTARIWQSWPEAEKRRFLRHARAYWEVHRHRAAPEIASQIEKLMAMGLLQIHKGRLVATSESGSSARVRWVGKNRMEWELEVSRVINCTGPDCDFTRIDQPLIAQLREAGLIVPDRLRLGIETDENGRVLDRSGAVVEGLLAVGPLRKARLWESTAMPEIRVQAEGVGGLLKE